MCLSPARQRLLWRRKILSRLTTSTMMPTVLPRKVLTEVVWILSTCSSTPLMSSVRSEMQFMLKWFPQCSIWRSFLFARLQLPKGFLCLPAVCIYFKQQRLNIIMIDVNNVCSRFEDFQFKGSSQHLESNRDYTLISVYCNTEFWISSSDKLSGYIKALAFSILDSLFFQLRLNSSGLRLLIFHNMS